MPSDEHELCKRVGELHHDLIVTFQAAWIEWQHGRGAEQAMVWVHNTLAGPGLVPDEDEEYGKEAQAWFDEHRSNPYPRCICGRPSHQQTKHGGFCSDEHRKMADDLSAPGGGREA